MDARILIEPQQGTNYDEVLAFATRAEQLGFEGFFTSDHYQKMGDHSSGLPGPLDAWTTVTGLARDTERMSIGTLVSPVTFHNPGQLAIRVAQVDHMSSGRVQLGIGAGWFEEEHNSYGIAFPPMAERFERLGEALEIITGLWATSEGDAFSFAGEHYTLSGSPALPKPRQRPMPPIIIGGTGKRITPRLASRYANEFNVPFKSPSDWVAACGPTVEACEERERDPETLVWSAVQVLAVGSNEAEFSRRAAAIGRETSDLRQNGVAGIADEALGCIEEFKAAGCDRLYFQCLDLNDLDQLNELAEILQL